MPSPIASMIRKTVTKGMMAVASFNRRACRRRTSRTRS